MLVVAFVVDRVAAGLTELAEISAVRGWGREETIKTTVSVEVNINSPQIGQSHSVDRSMHLCEFSSAIDMHTPHRW